MRRVAHRAVPADLGRGAGRGSGLAERYPYRFGLRRIRPPGRCGPEHPHPGSHAAEAVADVRGLVQHRHPLPPASTAISRASARPSSGCRRASCPIKVTGSPNFWTDPAVWAPGRSSRAITVRRRGSCFPLASGRASRSRRTKWPRARTGGPPLLPSTIPPGKSRFSYRTAISSLVPGLYAGDLIWALRARPSRAAAISPTWILAGPMRTCSR